MNKVFEKRLTALLATGAGSVLAGGRKGIEKESLRVTPEGTLSSRSHPAALGSALTNEFITTDFSEALLEFVTPAFGSTWEALTCLRDIHHFTYERLDDELLWVASMPCLITPDRDIPLARYGDSNVGKMKTIYRRGLGYRYGRTMQTISGIHFNYSLPDAFWPAYRDARSSEMTAADFQSSEYLGLVRNFRRFGWLIPYLFGASPAVCKSFVGDVEHGLADFDGTTLFGPYATSLRMSDLGYSNKSQSAINISLNSLGEYIDGLSAAIDTPDPAYEEIGVRVDGRYRQLSANKLQIENEYYSPVRPKRVAHSGERPTSALRRGGIQYVEIRSLDLSLVDPIGISQNTMRFVEAFLIYCLLSESPPITDEECRELASNHVAAAKRGREPGLELGRHGRAVLLADWGAEIFTGIEAIAQQIDAEAGTNDYTAACAQLRTLLDDPETTPSARILDDLRTRDVGFFHYALECAQNAKNYFRRLPPLSSERERQLVGEAEASHRRQAEIEASDSQSFEDYLAGYYAS